MTNNKKIIYFLVVLIGLTLIITAFLIEQNKEEDAPVVVNNFQDCLDAGYPALEIYPRQCQTPDGRTFIEELSDPVETCQDLCGDGTCQEVVCQALGCPCSESTNNCPEDCE